ncbi:multifunctional protein ade2 [Holotrichia oblita]|uniref:Multifunctional protein ade2 n=1 Tax=Holotrichia oblita TaxID=644536 RepID=A0ACB9TMP1_HOLOL|nr:multifunctional protein ade2 [Holotrichia oblita]
MEEQLYKVELVSPEGYKFIVNLSTYEIERAQQEPEFLNELIQKYDMFRKRDIIYSIKDTEANTNKSISEEIENKSDFWSENETKLLINTYADHIEDMQHAQRKKHVWSIIAEQLASLGVNRSVEKCQRKWINLTRVYRSIKDSSKKTGRGRTSYKYFDLLDEILGNKPSNSKDTYVLDFGASSSTTTGDVIKDPIELDSNENINTSEGISVEDGPPRKKRNKNYTQEYFKEKVKYLRNKENEHELKEKDIKTE